jgi:acetyl esterase
MIALRLVIPLLLSVICASAAQEVIRHTYKSTEKRPLELVCHLPSGWTPADRRPAVVFFFGGGFWTRNIEQFERQAAYFSRRGLVAILADYSTGEKDGTKPPAAFEDARSAMRWVRANAGKLGLDPNRIAAGGGSAGGSLAAALVIPDGLDAPGEDRAISVRPDALLLFNPGLSTTANERTLARFGSDASWRRTAAALHVASDFPSVLLLYGSQDNLLTGGRAWANLLRAAGVKVEMQVTDGAGHGFFNFSPHLAETTLQADRFLQSIGWLSELPQVPLPEGGANLSDSAGNPERGRP